MPQRRNLLQAPEAPEAVVMIRPHRFRPNPETLSGNAIQRPTSGAAESPARRRIARIHLTPRPTKETV